MTSGEAEPYETSVPFQAERTAIVTALEEGRRSYHPDSRLLRDVVRSCATHAREHAMPPETLVRALKSLVRDVALQDSSDAYRVIYTDRIIAWAIEAYYELSER